jgi:hypothetical protein
MFMPSFSVVICLGSPSMNNASPTLWIPRDTFVSENGRRNKAFICSAGATKSIFSDKSIVPTRLPNWLTKLLLSQLAHESTLCAVLQFRQQQFSQPIWQSRWNNRFVWKNRFRSTSRTYESFVSSTVFRHKCISRYPQRRWRVVHRWWSQTNDDGERWHEHATCD